MTHPEPLQSVSKPWNERKIKEYRREAGRYFTPTKAATGTMFIPRDDRVSPDGDTIDRAVERALEEDNQQLILTGDSGVGKTNLLVFWSESLNMKHYVLNTLKGQGLPEIVDDAVRRMRGKKTEVQSTKTSHAAQSNAAFKVSPLGLGKSKTSTAEVTETPVGGTPHATLAETMYESGYRLLILDNLQELTKEVRSLIGGMMEYFADLDRQEPDWEWHPKIAAAGIARNASELLENNLSRQRRIASISVPHMAAPQILKLARNGFTQLNTPVEDDALERIAFYSDGFPYFAHRISKLVAEEYAESSSETLSTTVVEQAVRRVFSGGNDEFEELLKDARGRDSRVRVRAKALELIAKDSKNEWDSSAVKALWKTHGFSGDPGTNLSTALNQLVTMNILDSNELGGRKYYRFTNPQMRPYVRMHPDPRELR